MQALVLVGGEGTRLRPLTERLPKPALPLAGRPFISYMLDWLRGHGVDEVVLACGFEPAKLRAAIGDGDPGQRLRYLIEPERLGTGGAIRYAEGVLADRFLALNGDLLCDLDLTALVGEHERSGAAATIALVRVRDATGYGLVRRDDDGWVTEFVEKPDPGEAPAGGEINAGAYVLERSALERIPAGREVSIEREVFPSLIGEGLRGVVLEGYWLDIGTPERLLQASWDILERRVETTVGELAAPDGLLVEAGASVSPDAVVTPPALVCSGAELEAGARVGPRAVAGPGSRIGPGAEIGDSLLGERCSVGPDAVLHGAILAPGAEVAAGARLGPGSVIAEGEMVGAP
jgi:mannose-1-phosphate guanylyltransferase